MLQVSTILRCAAVPALALAVLLFAGIAPASADGVRLIMVEQDGCHWCIEWDREIGPGYSKSAEGRFAPLKRVKRGDAALKTFDPVIYTPTFLVVRNGEEVGRVTGYAGKMFFYEELDEQLAKAGFTANWGIPELDKTRTQLPARANAANVALGSPAYAQR